MAKLITLENLSRFKTNCDDTYIAKELVDDTPTDNSENLVTSGGVKDYVDTAIANSIITALNTEV